MRGELGYEDVTLRRWRSADVPELHRVVQESLDHLAPWMPWVSGGYSVTDAADFIAGAEDEWARGVAFHYAITVGGEVAGAASLMARIGPGGLEIGYWLHPARVGLGLASKAARALTEAAFEAGADRVEIVTDVANTRSAAVPRRLGFVEVARRPAQEPLTPAESGTDIIWRCAPDGGRPG